MAQFKSIEEANAAYDAILAEKTELTERVDAIELERRQAVKESIQRKNQIKELNERINHITDPLKKNGIDIDSEDIETQLEKFKSTIKSGTMPESEYATQIARIQKKLDQYEKDANNARAEVESERLKNKIEKASNAFRAKISDDFEDPDLVVDHARNKGLIVLDENDVPAFKYGDELYPLSVEKGTSGVDMLKKMYPKQVKTNQTPGGKDTRGAGGRSGSEIKTMTLKDFDALPLEQKPAIIADMRSGKLEVVE